jgi:hypothetical protein
MDPHDHDRRPAAAQTLRDASRNETLDRGNQAMSSLVSGRVAMLAGASLGIVALFYALREHWGHTLGVLPYLLLLACPLLHLFHGHGGHGHSHEDQDRRKP